MRNLNRLFAFLLSLGMAFGQPSNGFALGSPSSVLPQTPNLFTAQALAPQVAAMPEHQKDILTREVHIILTLKEKYTLLAYLKTGAGVNTRSMDETKKSLFKARSITPVERKRIEQIESQLMDFLNHPKLEAIHLYAMNIWKSSVDKIIEAKKRRIHFANYEEINNLFGDLYGSRKRRVSSNLWESLLDGQEKGLLSIKESTNKDVPLKPTSFPRIEEKPVDPVATPAPDTAGFGRLNAEEKTIVTWVSKGLNNGEIAKQVNKPAHAVQSRLQDIYKKLDLHGRESRKWLARLYNVITVLERSFPQAIETLNLPELHKALRGVLHETAEKVLVVGLGHPGLVLALPVLGVEEVIIDHMAIVSEVMSSLFPIIGKDGIKRDPMFLTMKIDAIHHHYETHAELLAPNTYDMAFMLSVLGKNGFNGDPRQAIMNLYDVVKSGGIIYLPNGPLGLHESPTLQFADLLSELCASCVIAPELNIIRTAYDLLDIKYGVNPQAENTPYRITKKPLDHAA